MNPETAGEVGSILRRRRLNLGLSTTAVAMAAGVKQSTVVRIEQGAFEYPRADTLARIAHALDLPLEEVFGPAGYTAPSELPHFRPYMRSKYRALPPEDVEKIERYAAKLAKRHGISLEGPKHGEDEAPEQ